MTTVEQNAPTTARIITIHGQKLATGLYWQNLTTTIQVNKEIIRVGREAGADMKCVPSVRNPLQAGYITRAELAGMSNVRSLAGGLAEIHTGSWLGMFKMPDDSGQYYFIAIQNDHILATSDIVGELDEIKTEFEQTLSVGGWQYVTVPEGLNYPGSTVIHSTLAEMLTKRRAPKIKALEFKFEHLPIRRILYLLSAVAVLTVAWLIYTNWQEEQEQKRQEEIRRLMQERASAQAILPPWTKSVPVERFLTTCEDEFQTVKHSIVGWELKEWGCESHQTTVSYNKAPMASVVQFMHAVPGSSFSATGNQAALITPIAMQANGSRPASRGIAAKAAIMDYAENHVLNVVFTPAPPLQPLPGNQAPPPPPWTLENVTFDSSYPVFGLIELTRVPGLIIKRISATKDNADWKWHMDGEVYAVQ